MNEFESVEPESFEDELGEFSGEMQDEFRKGMPLRSRAGSRTPLRPAPRTRRPGPMRGRSQPPLRPRRPGFRPGFSGAVSYTAHPAASAGLGSERVRWAQDCLNRAMSTQLPVDGVMTAAARSAVRSFQKQQGLNVTGILGPDTEEALKRACAGLAQPQAATDSAPADEPATDAPSGDGEFGFATADELGNVASFDESEVDVAMRQALAQFPPRERPEYVSRGKLKDAIRTVSGAGLYLIRFHVNGKEMAYHGMATDLRKRLMQHRRCAQMLGLSIDGHTVSTAALPRNIDPRTRERPINAYLRRHHRPWFTNQRAEVEEAALAEIST